jgi:hypothetical protein
VSVQSQPAKARLEEPKPVKIRVNNKTVELPDRHTTGAEIKQAAGIPLDFKLYGPKGDEITNEQELEVHRNEKFTAISGQDVS